MPSNGSPKCITRNESNIPVFKSSGGKKSQIRSQFPELQKYIETIINASNESNSEDVPDKGEKLSKPGKPGFNAVQNENKNIKKRKFSSHLNSEKVNEKTKTTVSVSSRENISNQFFTDFEDPRNWEIVTAQNDFQKNKKIEKVLKNLFPNPYKLLQIPELNKSKISMYIEKIGNDDVTLPDVIISELDAQKTLDSTRVEINFEAEYDQSSSRTDFPTLTSSSSDKNRRAKACYEGSASNFSDVVTLQTSSRSFKNTAANKNNNSTVRQSSFENIKHSNSICTEKKEARERILNFGRQRIPKSRKNSRELLIDCDIGKLNLLMITDSDDSSKDTRQKDRKSREDLKKRINSNESSRIDEAHFSPRMIKESRMVKEFFEELNHKHKVNQTETRNRSKSDGGERKPLVRNKQKRKKSVKTATDVCPKIVESGSNDYEEPKLKSSKPTGVEVRKEESSASEGQKLKSGDEAREEATEKIDEVLRFMCDCLKKFKNADDLVRGNLSTGTDDEKELRGHKWPELGKPPTRKWLESEDFPILKRAETPQVVFHSSSSKRLNASSLSRLEKRFQLARLDQSVIENPDVPDTVYPDSREISNEDIVHTVEIQNELGGYTEEQHQTPVFPKDIRVAKSILPLSVKMKKKDTDTYKVLKNALEREERLLSGEFNMNKLSPRNDFFGSSVNLLRKESHTSCSVVGAFKRQHSNFVICVNSLPRSMRIWNPSCITEGPWTISLEEIPRQIIRPLQYYQTLNSEAIQLDGSQRVTQQALKEEIMLIMYRSTVLQVSILIGVSFVVGFSQVNDETLLKNAETPIRNKFRPIKKSFYVKPSTPPKTITFEIETCQKIDLDLSLNLNSQVEALEEAMEQTEKVYFLDQDCGTTYTLSETSTLSRNEMIRNIEWNEAGEKRKLHDLLIRTYYLEHKLLWHLKRLMDKPTSVSCPLIKQDVALDFGLASRNSEVLLRPVNKSSEEAMVYWRLQAPPPKSDVLDKALSVEIEKIDQGTLYDPPGTEGLKNINEKAESDDDDDGSSTCSFKSSIDFSENEKELTVSQAKENTKQPRFFRYILNEIETLKNRKMFEKDTEGEMEMMKNERTCCNEKKLTASCESITPTKLLTTVFKGKESMTELSLGLKAVPLNKVSNISVEKRKISENHTKISICISKEKTNELSEDQATSKDMMHSRLSNYLSSMKPSLSSSHTDYSRMENEIRRGESEDDEDFKSVMSTLSRPRSEINLGNEVKEARKIEISPPKSYTKHRFDFYQKMQTSDKIRKKSMSNTSCTYKEFEPLKQALTEMQIRMRRIRRDAYFSSNDYYQRALKLAKMSAGYCQSCGSRSVIPQDTFGYYNAVLPRNRKHGPRLCHLKTTPPRSSYYSLQSNFAELSDQFCDLDLRESSSYVLNSSRTIIRNSLNEAPTYSSRF